MEYPLTDFETSQSSLPSQLGNWYFNMASRSNGTEDKVGTDNIVKTPSTA